MKNLRMFQAAIVIFLVSLVVGCSDQLTSSGESENFELSKTPGKEVIPTVEESSSPDNYFRIQIRLKPHRAYTFNASNTGFDELNSIDIENLSIDADDVVADSDKNEGECQDILVLGNTTDDGLLSCHSRGFNFKEIIVENTGSRMLDLDVAIGGMKKKYIFPVDSE